MNAFWTLFKYEIKQFFVSPSTYVVSFLFLIIMSACYVIILLDFNTYEQENLPSTVFFQLFWLPVFFMVPILTMRSFAEIKQNGVLESLKAVSISSYTIVWSKILSAYLFYLFLWAQTATFPLVIKYCLSQGTIDGRLTDFLTWFSGYTFIAISGFAFISIGIFASCLTKSQVIASILCFCALFLLIIGVRMLTELPFLRDFEWINSFQVFDHLNEFSRGIIDTRTFMFYVTLGVLFSQATVIISEIND